VRTVIEVEHLSLTYHSAKQAHLAVDDVSFAVKTGQFHTLLGPSGCGKTTTLRSVAGLERPDGGEVRIDGALVSSAAKGIWIPPNRRSIGMVFQSYAIWPHMSVFENAAFPLRYGTKQVPSADVRRRVMAALEMVQLGHLADRAAPHLSGGQQQRLALARAFVMEPKVLLLDEPLSNIDAKLREEMRIELRRLVKSMDMTTIFVTHEQIEALTLSDVIAVMKDGKIVQQGTPLQIYQNPVNAFVADFIGRSNLIPGAVMAAEGGELVRIDGPLGPLVCVAPAQPTAGSIMVAIRPEHLALAPSGGAQHENRIEGVVDAAAFAGNMMDCTVRVGQHSLKLQLHPERAPAVGSAVSLYVQAKHCLAIVG
jgi:iron(III) transport system ATP-binding protein